MSTAVVSSPTAPQSAKPAAGAVTARRAPRSAGRQLGSRLQVTPVSREAQRFAAAILEVLAGVRTPTEAAAAMEVSVPRYYLWEQRALEGLVRACQPRPQGKAASERHQVARLEKELARLRQECGRQQALVRATQRTIGLAPSPQPSAKASAKPGGKAAGKTPAKAAGNGKGKRKRRPVARALIAVTALHASSANDHDHGYMVPDMVPENAADSSLANAAEVVQRSVPSSSSARTEAACAASVVSEA